MQNLSQKDSEGWKKGFTSSREGARHSCGTGYKQVTQFSGPDRTEREIAAAAAAAAVAADRLSLMAEVPASESERSPITTTTTTTAVVVVDEAEEKPKSDTGEEHFQQQQAKEEKPNNQLSKENFLQSDSTNTSNGTSAKVTAPTIGLTSISAPLHHHRQSNSSSSGSSNSNSNNNNMTSCQDNLISPHPHDSGIAADLDDTTQSATPLNLTMKKKRRIDNLDSLRATFANRSQQIMENNGKINHNNNNHLPIARQLQQQQQLLLNGTASTTVSKSAFEAVSNAALFSHEVNMPSALTAALSSTPASPLLLNRLLPFTFLPNGGSFTNPNPNPNPNTNITNNNNNNQNLPSQSASASTTVHSPFNVHDLLFGGYFTAMPTTTTTGKQQRPFKAYNPMDPMSALQINGLNFTSVNGGTAGAALLGTMPVGSVSTAQYLTEHLLHPYRQYLHHQQQLKAVLGLGTGRGASAASQAVVRTKSTEITSTPTPTPEVNGRCASRASSLPLQLAGEIASLLNVDNRGNHSTSGAQMPPSPPEVTSTSHPHTDLQHLPNASDHQHQQQQQQQQQHGNNVQAKKSQQKAQKQQKAPKRDNTNNNKAGRPDQQQQQQQPGRRPASSSSTGSSNNGRSSSSVAANGLSSPVVSDEQQQREESNTAASVATIPTAQLNGNSNNNNNNNNNNAGMGSKRKGRLQTEPLKDEAYWERRRKNNEAAKRSRDARRAKEDEIAVRAALLEQENMRLRIEVAALKAETEKLRQMLLTG
ncbi:Hepatic leukemia factor [Trichinella papuae]|uniref:Hepatic leukemia factor n=1 Tax=Trichinella papuae TaxID=268474 RepID=A0A0V1MRP0_9BILA|nr:Hepatic leukemia factor [Trichinella papuae]